MTSAHIRPVVSADFDQWRRLYQGYADFYQVALSDDGVQTTWSWLIEPAHVCTGLVAEQPDGLVGLAHFRGMPSPLRGQMIGFLDDLFVTPAHRSDGTAAALITAVQAEATAQGWACCAGSRVTIITGRVGCMTKWRRRPIGRCMK